MTIRDEILATKINGYLNLDIEGDSKIVIDSFIKMIIIPCSIILINERCLEIVSRAKCISLLSTYLKKQIELWIVTPKKIKYYGF